MAQPPTLVLQCTQQQLAVHERLHNIACQEASLLRAKQGHEAEWRNKDSDERLRELQRLLCEARVETEQLKLDGLRQRKQNSILRLKLASCKEDVDLLQRNLGALDQHNQRLQQELAQSQAQLAAATQQLTDMSADHALVQADCAKHQGQALLLDTEVTQLNEELKLMIGRLNTANSQTADAVQQLKAQQAENASLQGQLAQSQGRDSEAAAAHRTLQEALDGMARDQSSLKHQLAVEEQRRLAAESAAAKAQAAAQAASEMLAVKEQQLAGWRDLEKASKEAASQQMQMSQAQLDSLRERASSTEAKLLDQIATLQEQLAHERSARCALEASNMHAVAAGQSEMQHELAMLRQQATAAKKELATAQARAKKEAKRAAELQLELEQAHEHDTQAAVEVVGQLVEGLTQGATDSEDESEQQLSAQPPSSTRRQASTAARRAAAAAAADATAAAGASVGRSRPSSAAARFGGGAAANLLRGITEGEEADADDSDAEQGVQQQQQSKAAAAVHNRPTRGARARAQEGIRASIAAAGATPASAAARSEEEQGMQQHTAKKPSPASRNSSRAKQALPEQHTQPPSSAGRRAAAAAAVSRPQPLSFVPQSATAPAVAVQQPGVARAAAQRVSASDMMKKLQQGPARPHGKPGSRKRKLGPPAGTVDTIPPSMLMSKPFKPPKVRHT